jgi:glycolate oxidase iron-sulfur subunit
MSEPGARPLAELSSAAVAEFQHCNKCGFCLPACPTYRETGSEVHSPRGRLALVEAAWRGEMPPDGDFARALSACLGCRACETACPSGVQYGVVLEAARAALYRRDRRYVVKNRAVEALLGVVQRRGWMRAALAAGRVARRWTVPAGLRPLVALLPPAAPRVDETPGARATGTVPVYYVTTCVMDTVYPDANAAAITLLAAAGARVDAPADQPCCGALHLHAGDETTARRLARANLARFSRLPPDTWLVTHAGGCAAMIQEYGRLLADDPTWAAAARYWSTRVRDFASALGALPFRLEFRGSGARVGLQNSCHLVNVLGRGAATVDLLGQVSGDAFVALPGQDRCCGSAGVYNLLEPAMAARILQRHLTEVEAARLDVWVTNNPGCQLQCEQGVRAAGLPTAATHLATYLHSRWTGQRRPRDETASPS